MLTKAINSRFYRVYTAAYMSLCLLCAFYSNAAVSQVLQCSDINYSRLQSYKLLIEQAEKKHGLEADLIIAVIQVESGFNPRARSKAGARGLMQLMPETQRQLGVRSVFDPQQNIEGGTRYLRQQILRFGDVKKGLWAYNAGPHRVEKKLMFAETQRYIPSVLFYYWCMKNQEY